ncbi:class I SAM-dependent methyltransferase [Bacillus sp. FJAT-49732]|uniref:Class I SAM-dependent methyltransferase n=1 Tax=Lederbergia citrisecunda TaxID=2833583 RepID=A0A942TTH5_9BACI|nr:class I SAM-dependent methyltransferase [Lederbergia citrisecunda]MBS4201894.1 class I SAM-dependent methyltransferase [Lederbergia citrisecunda]
MFSNYGKLCTEFYDFTKPVGMSIDGDIEYYLDRLKHVHGRILEAGVGSGRFLIPLLEKGFVVDGLDYSADMLKSCKERCENRGFHPELYEGLLEDFHLPYKYEAIIMPTGTFGLLETRGAALNALTCFKNHLQPGGRIIIDLGLPNDFKVGDISNSVISFPNGEGITLEGRSIELDWVQQRTVTHLRYEKWKDGKLIDTELQRLVLSWYGIEEFKLILSDIGFTNVSVSSGYTYEKNPTSANEIITFEGEVD